MVKLNRPKPMHRKAGFSKGRPYEKGGNIKKKSKS